MRMLAAVLVSLGLLACSDSTSPDPIPDRLTITGGNSQEGVVGQRLANDLSVEASLGAQSVSGILICWVAVTEGAGFPWLPCADTNGSGEASTPWDLGTLAGDHSVEARAMVDGEPAVVATYALHSLPDAITGFMIDPEGGVRWHEDSVDIRTSIRHAVDQYTNRIEEQVLADRLASIDEREVTWMWEDRSQNSEASGPSGTGWVVSVPNFSEHGYRSRDGRHAVRLVWTVAEVAPVNFTGISYRVPVVD